MNSEKKRIIFFGELPSGCVTGISLSNKLNLEILRESGFEVEIVEERTHLRQHKKRGIKKILSVLLNYLRFVYVLMKNTRFDYLYFTISLSKFGIIKTYLSALSFELLSSRRAAAILHLHRGDFVDFYNKSKWNRFLSRRILGKIDTLIVLGESQIEQFLDFYDLRIKVVRNTVESEFEVCDKDCHQPYRFLYLSNYIESKGILDLLEVFSQYDDAVLGAFHLDCYGTSICDQFTEQLKKFSSEQIKINGGVFGQKKYEIIASSHVLILPSWNEGAPTVVLEAMSVGTVVIVTDVGLVREMLGKDYPFICKPRDPKALDDVIRKYVEWLDKETISRQLKDRYQKYYSFEAHRKELLDVFLFRE
ncbi:glycosyltransferase family 4 protein [Akkermansiaceae bacterium]|nr:glycosyltransferase family 4 protein [Akkermansiaceae bacterium]